MSVYEFKAPSIRGDQVDLSEYRGKVLVIANTASKCGLTPQYEGLQALYEKYKDQGLVVLGFPCNQFAEQEPGTEAEVESFCKLNYGVTFPLFAKADVNGDEALPLFKYLKGETGGADIAWNFTKFVIDRDGRVAKRFEPKETPETMAADIESLL
ncbi:glutathione peroxidase [Cohnella rhizosphaerae]|uniref:Glutathione peroxidase n=1 Tax=Cohnella rhizosphaerae TaxID=1457232 RepID=A0A9X4QW19_9BACL|nr:glutathione peroxidase [Cohnella rhizosphaerae]MDG0813164.1 glutathione peroxidase [Cohnella rhizosphaerae]